MKEYANLFRFFSADNLDPPGELVFSPLTTLPSIIYTTFAVVKRKPEKNQACTGFEPYDLCDTGQALYQLSYQANRELVIWSVLNKPVKDKDERMNI